MSEDAAGGENNKQLRGFRRRMLDGEQILAWAAAQRLSDRSIGVAVLTQRRLAFFSEGWFTTRYEPVPIDRIGSVEVIERRGYFGMTVRSTHDDLGLRFVVPEKARILVGKLQEVIHAAVAPTPDPLGQIEALARLHKSGVLSEAEFAAKKADLLARI